MPVVTVFSLPRGLPMAITVSPTSRSDEVPRGAAGSRRPACTRSSATSLRTSTLTSSAGSSLPSLKRTRMGADSSSRTCALVRIQPSGSITKPDPRLVLVERCSSQSCR